MGQHHSPFYSPLPTQPLTQSCTWPFFLIPIPSAPLPPVSRLQKQAWDLSLTGESRLDTGAGQPRAGSTGLERVLGLGEGQGQGNQRGCVTAGVWVGQGRTKGTMARFKTHSDSARNIAHILDGNNDHGAGPVPCSVLFPQ